MAWRLAMQLFQLAVKLSSSVSVFYNGHHAHVQVHRRPLHARPCPQHTPRPRRACAAKVRGSHRHASGVLRCRTLALVRPRGDAPVLSDSSVAFGAEGRDMFLCRFLRRHRRPRVLPDSSGVVPFRTLRWRCQISPRPCSARQRAAEIRSCARAAFWYIRNGCCRICPQFLPSQTSALSAFSVQLQREDKDSFLCRFLIRQKRVLPDPFAI